MTNQEEIPEFGGRISVIVPSPRFATTIRCIVPLIDQLAHDLTRFFACLLHEPRW